MDEMPRPVKIFVRVPRALGAKVSPKRWPRDTAALGNQPLRVLALPATVVTVGQVCAKRGGLWHGRT